MEMTERTELTKLGFALGSVIILFSGFIIPFTHHQIYSLNSLLVGLILIITAALQPQALKPLNHFWKFAGEILGYINLRIILGFMYFCIIVPIGIVKRIISKPTLALSFDPLATTYRIKSINADPNQLEKPF